MCRELLSCNIVHLLPGHTVPTHSHTLLGLLFQPSLVALGGGGSTLHVHTCCGHDSFLRYTYGFLDPEGTLMNPRNVILLAEKWFVN